jgi:SAM-dependent methyltransferase
VHQFTCNICNSDCAAELPNREVPTCPNCASPVRFRWIVHAVSMQLFGESLPLPSFPDAKHIRGVGMSDPHCIGTEFSAKFDYTNTYYHQDPKLDITQSDAGDEGKYDFIICSEVFEHIPLPIQIAFDNLYRLLKPDGFVVFSTPWLPEGETKEHYPDLHEWQIAKLRGGDYILINRKAEGQFEVFEDLCFHGGPGTTLEFRLFTKPDLTRHFENAGFKQILFSPQDECPPFGIVWEPWSTGVVVRKSLPA